MTPRSVESSITLEQAFDEFLNDPARSRAVKTASHYVNLRAITTGLWGDQMKLASLGREDCRRLLSTLCLLPRNAAKRFPNTPFSRIIEQAESGQLRRPMRPATVNGYMAKFRAMLNYSVNEGWIDRNPSRGLGVLDPVRARDKRLPFSPVQLQLIFNAPIYRGCQDDQHGYALPGPLHPRRARFWIPLLALFAGLRMNEACQLEAGDVVLAEGVTCIFVTSASKTGPAKRLKTLASERLVPLHPELVRIGFLSFVADARQTGRSRLFPELSPGSSGYLSDPFSKWFQRFLIKAGASAPKTCFHSFRHSFRDALREAGIRHEVALALGGWASDDAADAHAAYGRGFSPRVLNEAMCKIAYPVSLDHLIDHTNLAACEALGQKVR